jgi:hypothetical protein
MFPEASGQEAGPLDYDLYPFFSNFCHQRTLFAIIDLVILSDL